MGNPLISIVVPTYNRAHLLPRLFESVFCQTYPHWELVIVDDASTDNTPLVLRGYQEQHPNVKVISLSTNGGAGRARNAGVKQAKGAYVAFLDDDDVALPTRLEKQLQFLSANPAVDLCFSLIRWMNVPLELQIERPAALLRNEIPADPRSLFRYLLCNSCVPTPTIVVKASVIQKYPFAEDVEIAEDLYPILTMAANGASIRGMPEVLVLVERGGREGRSLDPQRQYRDHMKVLHRVFAEQRVAGLLQRQAMAGHVAYYAMFLNLPPLQSLGMLARSIWLWPFQRQSLRTFSHLCRRSLKSLKREPAP